MLTIFTQLGGRKCWTWVSILAGIFHWGDLRLSECDLRNLLEKLQLDCWKTIYFYGKTNTPLWHIFNLYTVWTRTFSHFRTQFSLNLTKINAWKGKGFICKTNGLSLNVRYYWVMYERSIKIFRTKGGRREKHCMLWMFAQSWQIWQRLMENF